MTLKAVTRVLQRKTGDISETVSKRYGLNYYKSLIECSIRPDRLNGNH